MKLLMKRFALLCLAALLLLPLGCEKKDPEPVDEIVIDDPLLKGAEPAPDNARVFYEIFTGSFSDSFRQTSVLTV